MAEKPIAHIIHIIASSGFFGAERVIANLVVAMPPPVTVFCLNRDPQLVAAFEQRVLASGARFIHAPFGLRKALNCLRSEVDNQAVSILHAHGYKETVLACLLQVGMALRKHPVAVITTQHGFTARNLKSRLYNLINLALSRWMPIAKVIAVSAPILAIYRRFGVREQRLALIANGTLLGPQRDKQEARQQLAARWQLNPQALWLCFVGRFSAEKNPLLFVDICRACAEQGATVVGIMAGSGPQQAEVDAACADLPAKLRVLPIGFVSDVDGLLAGVDFLVVPSVTEGTPMVVLEAMWQRTAVVAAEVGGLPDMISHGVNGYLVAGHQAKDYADTVLNASQPQARADLLELGSQAAQRVANVYSVSAQADAYQAIYREALPR